MLVAERGPYPSSAMHPASGGGEDHEENTAGREPAVTEGRWRAAASAEGRVWARAGSGDVFVEQVSVAGGQHAMRRQGRGGGGRKVGFKQTVGPCGNELHPIKLGTHQPRRHKWNSLQPATTESLLSRAPWLPGRGSQTLDSKGQECRDPRKEEGAGVPRLDPRLRPELIFPFPGYRSIPHQAPAPLVPPPSPPARGEAGLGLTSAFGF